MAPGPQVVPPRPLGHFCFIVNTYSPCPFSLQYFLLPLPFSLFGEVSVLRVFPAIFLCAASIYCLSCFMLKLPVFTSRNISLNSQVQCRGLIPQLQYRSSSNSENKRTVGSDSCFLGRGTLEGHRICRREGEKDVLLKSCSWSWGITY